MTNSEGVVDILLIGLGSMGAIYAYLLEKTGKARVTAVARSNYDIYSTTGVTLDTHLYGVVKGWKPYRVFKTQAEALEGDVHYSFCLVTTKSLPDVTPTPVLLKDVIDSGKVGAWVLNQNGLDIEKDLYDAVPKSTPIISCCVWIGIMTSPDGMIVKWAGLKGTMVCGLYPPSPKPDPQAQKKIEHWQSLLRAADHETHIEDDISSIRFSKNIWNIVFASIQCFIHLTNDHIYNLPPQLQEEIRAYLAEVVDTGFKSGLLKEGMVQYPSGKVVQSREEVMEHGWWPVHSAGKQGARHKMSMWIDVENRRPIEVEVIVGAVVRIAEKHGVEVPRLRFVYALLKAMQADFIGRKANGSS